MILGDVGRYRINRKLKMDTSDEIKVLTKAGYYCNR